MKKFFLMAVALVGSFVCANAADSYAPEKGDFSTEINFTPFKSNGQMFNMPGVSVRYFVTDKDAVLLELGLNGTNKKSVSDTETNPDAFSKGYNGNFSIDLGYQRHFYNNGRLDLYAGGKVGYFHTFAGSTTQYDKNNKTWSNSYNGVDTANGIELYANAGLDFYIYKGLFVGLEVNLGFSDAFAVNHCTKTTVAGVETESKSHVGGHDFNGGFSVKPELRLGWRF